jgi:hypothetical protein
MEWYTSKKMNEQLLQNIIICTSHSKVILSEKEQIVRDLSCEGQKPLELKCVWFRHKYTISPSYPQAPSLWIQPTMH